MFYGPGQNTRPATLNDIKTDGTWYYPLDGIEGEERTVASWEECRDRCINTEGCIYFNRFSNGGCHITDGRDGSSINVSNRTTHSGRAEVLENGEFKINNYENSGVCSSISDQVVCDANNNCDWDSSSDPPTCLPSYYNLRGLG